MTKLATLPAWPSQQRNDFVLWTIICFLAVGRFSRELIPIEVAGLTSNQLILYAILGLLSVRAIRKGYAGMALQGALLPLTILSAWALASVLWSQVPVESGIKAITFILVILAAIYISVFLPYRLLIKGLVLGLCLAVVISAFLAVLLPGVAGTTMFHDGAWRGLYEQRNVLGRGTVLAILFILVFAFTETTEKWKLAAILAVCVTTMVKTGSATSLASVALFVAIFPIARIGFLRDPRVRLVAMIVFVPSLAMVVIAGYNYSSTLVELMGRSGDLTGRVPLWIYVVSRWKEALMTGYGLDAFFTPINIINMTNMFAWAPEHSHNGFLDLAIELGLVGLFLMLTALLMIFASLPYDRGKLRGEAVFGLSVIIILILQNMTESNLYRSSNIIWIVFCVMTARLVWLRKRVKSAASAMPPSRRRALAPLRPA